MQPGSRGVGSNSSSGQGGVVVRPAAGAGQPQDAALVAAELGKFFSTLMVDLQGAQLRFRQLAFVPAAQGAQAPGQQLLQLDLDLLVDSFPPLDIQF
jgi:hypothetical protein